MPEICQDRSQGLEGVHRRRRDTGEWYGAYNRNNTRRVHINMVIDPREGNSNAQARKARALLFPRVNNHVYMDPEDFIPFYHMENITEILLYWPGDIALLKHANMQ